MPKICINAPDIVMSGDVSINAALSVSTKAKLDSINVGGDCDCGKKKRTVVVKDFVIVLDSSDSFGDSTDGGDAFGQHSAPWAQRFVGSLAQKYPDSRVAVVNFAGVPEKQPYTAGNNGECSHTATTGMRHYKVEVAPSYTRTVGTINMAALDGNGQLWLCLQDLTLPNFTSNLLRNDRVIETATEIINYTYQTEMVIVTDDDWDLKGDKLKTTNGSTATMAGITQQLHSCYDKVNMLIVRERDSTNNDNKILSLCKGSGTYHKITASSITTDMDQATKKMLA